jgi:hypothetical protein
MQEKDQKSEISSFFDANDNINELFVQIFEKYDKKRFSSFKAVYFTVVSDATAQILLTPFFNVIFTSSLIPSS